ncbi:glutamate-1-semialdehyde 2,1-aminomutase [bacterium]|nr:glutamate-1-semialdehyde 2,1-aminomutase [bacterium]
MKPLSFDRSQTLHERAAQSIVGGVNSPARAFRSVGGTPLFAARAEGYHVWDADGNRYIDYIGSWGPMIAGHAHPEVIAAINHAAALGTSYGVSTEREILIAEKIRSMMPSIEMLRMVNSGTEAAMSAIRLARGYTGRSKIIKFAGCYHGHGDSFLIKAGSGALTHGVPDSAGIPPSIASDTLVAEFNSLDSVDRLLTAHASAVAAIIVEPVVGNMGTVPPEPGFLEGLRKRTADNGILLIFDEVITGFRLARGGAQGLFGVIPDLTTLGKIVGGGLPVGVYGGKAEIMSRLAPLGPVYQAGTLSGNPLAVAAGLATLNLIDNGETYTRLEKTGKQLADGFAEAAAQAGVPVTVNRAGSMMTVFFNEGPVTDYSGASKSDTARFSRFFRGMLNRGILLPPSQYEAMFVSTAHDDRAIEMTIAAAGESLNECR